MTVDFDYQDWLAQKKRDVEEQRAEAIADSHQDPDNYDQDRHQDDYDNAAYGGRVDYYPG